MNTNVALFYKTEAFSSNQRQLMGRNVAGNTFLDALLEYGSSNILSLVVEDRNSLESIEELKANYSGKVKIKTIKPRAFQALADVGSFFVPGPDIARFCSRRSFIGHSKWSTVGLTHTTASIRVMDGIGELLTGPIQPWDAVICTSNAVKSHLVAILEAKKNYLIHRLNIKKVPSINLPVIPLGIDTRRFQPLREEKKIARKSLKISSQEIVISFVGRLSWHAKAHPMPMYIALAEVSKATGRKIVLVECGWHANEVASNVFKDAQAIFSDNIRFLYVDGREAKNVNNVYSATDIFVSLSDNIQETFGITPLEAMSAGIPVIVSDWDGYRETVRDGVDGFRIQTFTPAETHQQDLIYRYELGIDTYDYYCGHTSMTNIIDVGQLINRVKTLVENNDLRKSMGEAASKRAREVYDWSVIIRQYEYLWRELNDIRSQNVDETLFGPSIWPERLDPMIAFKEYPTKKLRYTDQLERGVVSSVLLERIMNNHMITYANEVVCSAEKAQNTLKKFHKPHFTTKELALSLAPNNLRLGMRLVANLVKFDIVRLSSGANT